LEKAIKDLGQPGNVENFRDAMKELGRRAVKTDDAFYDVWMTLANIVAHHEDQYPGVKPFFEEWDGHRRNWRNYIDTSRNFAFQTGDDYQLYTSLLQNIGKITTKEQMVALAADLREFAKSGPVGVPVDFKDKFLELKRNVENFQERFYKYLNQQGITLTQKANNLKDLIDGLETKIADLDRQINVTTASLEIASWWGPVAAALSGTVLADLAIPRANKQDEFDGKRNDLKLVEAEQTPLGVVKAQLSGLIPDFKLLSENLGLFADTWNAFHNEAVEFAAKFEKLETPANLPALFRSRINLAIVVSDALYNGLRDYVGSTP